MSSKQGIHRSTSNSRAGRSMIKIGVTPNPSALTKEQQDWNTRVEFEKSLKQSRKAEKRFYAK